MRGRIASEPPSGKPGARSGSRASGDEAPGNGAPSGVSFGRRRQLQSTKAGAGGVWRGRARMPRRRRRLPAAEGLDHSATSALPPLLAGPSWPFLSRRSGI